MAAPAEQDAPGGNRFAAWIASGPLWPRRFLAWAVDTLAAAVFLFVVSRLPWPWLAPLGSWGAAFAYLGVAGYYAQAWGRGSTTPGERLAALCMRPRGGGHDWASAILRALFQAAIPCAPALAAAWNRAFEFEPVAGGLGQLLILGVLPLGQALLPWLRGDGQSLIDRITSTEVRAEEDDRSSLPAPPPRRSAISWTIWGAAVLGLAALPFSAHSPDERALMKELARSRGILAARVTTLPLPPGAEPRPAGAGDHLRVVLWAKPEFFATLGQSDSIASHWMARVRAHHARGVERIALIVKSGPFTDLGIPSGVWRGEFVR